MNKNEQSLRKTWDTIKCIFIYVMETSVGEVRKKKKIIKEIMPENFQIC